MAANNRDVLDVLAPLSAWQREAWQEDRPLYQADLKERERVLPTAGLNFDGAVLALDKRMVVGRVDGMWLYGVDLVTEVDHRLFHDLPVNEIIWNQNGSGALLQTEAYDMSWLDARALFFEEPRILAGGNADVLLDSDLSMDGRRFVAGGWDGRGWLANVWSGAVTYLPRADDGTTYYDAQFVFDDTHVLHTGPEKTLVLSSCLGPRTRQIVPEHLRTGSFVPVSGRWLAHVNLPEITMLSLQHAVLKSRPGSEFGEDVQRFARLGPCGRLLTHHSSGHLRAWQADHRGCQLQWRSRTRWRILRLLTNRQNHHFCVVDHAYRAHFFDGLQLPPRRLGSYKDGMAMWTASIEFTHDGSHVVLSGAGRDVRIKRLFPLDPSVEAG